MSWPKYPAYKGSGVEWLGPIPVHWRIDLLKAVASCNDDILAEDTNPEHELEYVEISDVAEGRGILQTQPMKFGDAPSRARRVVVDGDILISTVRTYLRAIAAIQNPPPNLVASTGFAAIRPRDVLPKFLGYMLHCEFFVCEVISQSVGVSYPAINSREIMRIKGPIPPAPEQLAIAAFLDRETAKIDALIAEQERLIELLQEKRQAVISHAVTKGLNPDVPMKPSGVEWLGEVPAQWILKRIKHVVRSLDQGWSPQCEGYPVESAQEWGVLKVGCVNGGTFRPQENKALPCDLEPQPDLAVIAGDLLISRANTRELVGSAAVVPRDFANLLLCDKLYRLRVDANTCLAQYLGLYLGTSVVRGQVELAATGASSSMLNIGQSTIMNLDVALPDVLEQAAIVFHVDHDCGRLDALSEDAHAAVKLLQERRSALISAAVTGQIDIRGLVEQEAA